MTDLVVIVPSRGRPQAAAQVVKAFNETCTEDTQLVLALDGDDPTRDDYYGIGVRFNVQPSGTMVSALNRAALAAVSGRLDVFAVGFMGDDHRPRTHGWDKHYIDELRHLGSGLVYGNDLFQGERIPTQVAMTADIIRVLGYMAPPELVHMYVDNAWLDLGRALGRISYLPNVIVEHMHPLAGKAEWDAGHRRVNHPSIYVRDHAAYTRWVQQSLPVEIPRLRRLADA